jgi:2-keto-4-pentenoate hydratase
LDPTERGGRPRAVAASTTTEGFADQLWRAEHERSPIEPLTDLRPDLTLADAYAVQAYNVRRKVEAGRTIRGRRLGRTGQVRQHSGGADESAFGVLLDDMVVDEGEEIPFDDLLQPRVLATIAFVMAADLAGPGLTVADALTAVAGVLPAIEVADSRIADWRGRLPDTVADNASAGRVVLGSRLTPVGGLDLRLVGLLLYRNGAPIESGAGAAALGSPFRCVSLMAGARAGQGRGLRRGDIVLAGPLHRLVPVRAGDHFRVEFAHLGSVTAQFGAGGGAA